MDKKLNELAGRLEGQLYGGRTMRTLYATDASAFREIPLAVAIPASSRDLLELIRFAQREQSSLIPRTAGTSLAGQVVGGGIVVDLSKHFTRILELNLKEGWVRVQPGVIRDELNLFLKPHGLCFGPETSTANRAMMGGMVGNNSCGSNSVVYGSTRDHLLEVRGFLSDGSEAFFGPLCAEEFRAKCQGPDTLENRIYRQAEALLFSPENRQEILREFPKRSIHRRNTGYALDLLLETEPFQPGGAPFNFCRLIAGSEGTLILMTEIRVRVLPLPPSESALLCVHCQSVDESLRANILAMKHHPAASELIDHYILSCTEQNLEYRNYRFFIQGEPDAVLIIEFQGETRDQVSEAARHLEQDLREAGLGYAYPLLFGEDSKKVWALRKAGLGLLGNIPGDNKPVALAEDTAVAIEDLPQYIREFDEMLLSNGLYAVHYAHAGSGEIHLRPILNLKTAEGNRLFRQIGEAVASLVKKYQGSLSGEHGDGRLRGEFIPRMVGPKNYQFMRELKQTWDPAYLFNPGKIVDTPPMNTMLRYEPGQKVPAIPTYFDFGPVSVLQHTEQCNGSGDCRKTQLSGGTMCPSYMATRNEQDTTRARANILREFLTHSPKENRFDHREIYEVMDLCLACKGCKSECPSNVDMAKLKMEFLQHYQDAHGVPLRSRLVANFATISRLGSLAPGLYNALLKGRLSGGLVKRIAGFAPDRSLPAMPDQTLRSWFARRRNTGTSEIRGKVFLFCDEFTQYQDTAAGIKAVRLLERLGYEVVLPAHRESGRASLSKGLLRKARALAEDNIRALGGLVSQESPLVGLEPSAILSFRDEYPELVSNPLRSAARSLASRVFTLEEFLCREAGAGRIGPEQFSGETRHILLHGHCQQKALTGTRATREALSLPAAYHVTEIPSGCCGMAGSFGYEREHYALSQAIAELVLFPALRQASAEVLIAAPGTSCRHQIRDGLGRQALHPAEILHDALLG